MSYSFLTKFPVVTYQCDDEGRISLWVYTEESYVDLQRETRIGDIIKHDGLFEMCHPQLAELVIKIEQFFCKGALTHDNCYWIDNYGDWG